MKTYPVRYPEKHIEMMKDIARNRGVEIAMVFREAVEDFLSEYSTIPSMKALFRQVERHEREMAEIKKELLKKAILE